MQGRSIRPPKQPEVPARDHGEGGDGGGDGKEEEGRQEPGLQDDGCQAGRDPSASETSARFVPFTAEPVKKTTLYSILLLSRHCADSAERADQGDVV